MQRLSSLKGLAICQKKEWGEILTGFETKNKYVVMDDTGRELYAAAEVGGSVIARILLKAWRPFEIAVMTMDGGRLLQLKRPFRFFFHQLDVFDAQGQHLGTIQKRFSLVRRIYSVLDGSGAEMFQLFGPILHPWTFLIRKNEAECGKITKKWSGFAKEVFTDADNFGVTFPGDCETGLKGLLLGAVVAATDPSAVVAIFRDLGAPRRLSILRMRNGCGMLSNGVTSRIGRISTCEPGRKATAPSRATVKPPLTRPKMTPCTRSVAS